MSLRGALLLSRHLRCTAFPGSGPPGQVCCSAGEQSPRNRRLLRREEQVPSSQRHNEFWLFFILLREKSVDSSPYPYAKSVGAAKDECKNR